MDTIIENFASDKRLGLVFPSDPHLADWDMNGGIAEQLVAKMGLDAQLPHYFNFPVGTMFWARSAALAPLFKLQLRWDDYPEEPLPGDGTLLHALERILPFVASHNGYRYAITHIPGITWW